MTNHSTDLRDKFLALIERMEKAEDENARLRAELEAAKNQEPCGWQSNFVGEDKWASCSKEHYDAVKAAPNSWREYEVRAVYASPVPAQQRKSEREEFNAWNHENSCRLAGREPKTAAWMAWQARAQLAMAPTQHQEPIAYLSWEKSGDLDCTKYKPIRAGTEIFTHRVNSDSWEVLPVYASNIIAQQLTDAELENLRIKADAYDIACDDLERFQQSRVAAGKAPGTEGSLCDAMAWVYSRIDRLESELDSIHGSYEKAIETILIEIDSDLKVESGKFWDSVIAKLRKTQANEKRKP